MDGRIKPPTFEYIECRCYRCGFMNRLPVKPGWDNPLHVMEMEKRYEHLESYTRQVAKDLMELAAECVDAGVRPSVLKRADEMRQQLQSLLEWFKKQNKGDK